MEPFDDSTTIDHGYPFQGNCLLLLSEGLYDWYRQQKYPYHILFDLSEHFCFLYSLQLFEIEGYIDQSDLNYFERNTPLINDFVDHLLEQDLIKKTTSIHVYHK